MTDTDLNQLRKLALAHTPQKPTLHPNDFIMLIDKIEKLAQERDMVLEIAPTIVRENLVAIAAALELDVSDEMTNFDLQDAILSHISSGEL